MEDALISPVGLMILTGAGLLEASPTETIKVHTTEQTNAVEVDESGNATITLAEKPYTKGDENFIYVMLLDNGEVVSEPYIATVVTEGNTDGKKIIVKSTDDTIGGATAWTQTFKTGVAVLVDYYVEKASGASQIEITPDKFGGNYYLEASTLFRDTNGVDMPAEFVIPNCKIQSNFTFTMSSSGDPSSFSFVMDAFPDYTRFDDTKKVLAAIQIISETSTEEVLKRDKTQSERIANSAGQIVNAG